jgi:hypothetical protein
VGDFDTAAFDTEAFSTDAWDLVDSGLAWEVYADVADLAVYDAASGGGAVSTEGATVNWWANDGTLGTRLGKLSDKGGPLLRLNGGDPYLEFDGSGADGWALGIDVPAWGDSGDLTVHVLAKHTRADATYSSRVLWTTAGTSSGDSGKLACEAYNLDLGGPLVGFDSSDAPVYASNTPGDWVTDDRWHLLSFRRAAGSPSTWTTWVDGVKVHEGTTVNTEDECSRFCVGGPMYGTGFLGGVALAAFARESHTDEEVEDFWDDLGASHPLLAAPAVALVWCGDSTGAPANAYEPPDTATRFPTRALVRQVGDYLQTNADLETYYNQSVGGKGTAWHLEAEQLAQVTGLLGRATATPVLIVSSGTNDIRPGGEGLTPAQSYALIVNLIEAVRAEVPDTVVVVGTICDGDPATYGASFTADRNTLNALIVAGAGANDYTAARVDTDLVGSDFGTPGRDEDWFVGSNDGLHRTAPGMDREAPYYWEAVEAAIAEAAAAPHTVTGTWEYPSRAGTWEVPSRTGTWEVPE